AQLVIHTDRWIYCSLRIVEMPWIVLLESIKPIGRKPCPSWPHVLETVTFTDVPAAAVLTSAGVIASVHFESSVVLELFIPALYRYEITMFCTAVLVPVGIGTIPARQPSREAPTSAFFT